MIPRKQTLQLSSSAGTDDANSHTDDGVLGEAERQVEDDETDDVYFDYETRTWKKKELTLSQSPMVESGIENSSNLNFESHHDENSSGNDETEFYFDDGEMRWKSRPKPSISTHHNFSDAGKNDKTLTKYESNALLNPQPRKASLKPDKVCNICFFVAIS